MEENKAKLLAEKYKHGTCTPEELALIEQWYNQIGAPDHQLNQGQIQQSMDEVWGVMQKDIAPARYNWRPYAAVASLLVIGSFSFLYYKKNTDTSHSLMQDALPGEQKAILTLATGRSLQLSNAHAGVSFLEKEIKYTDGTKIANTATINLISSAPTNYVVTSEQNTIEAPLGGNYRVVLADGSTVWLNAGSKLTFPTNFAPYSAREVTLSGEAFFAVSKDPNRRFSVKTKDQQINVLGTKFNVESYPNQVSSKTTLVEGSVEIVNLQAGKHYGKKVVLKPNEQFEFTENEFVKKEANTEKTIAWKEGLFIFNDDPLIDIMRTLSRWYNVDVDYNSLPNNRFNGYISKDVKLSQVLEMLEITGNSTFKLENNSIKAYQKNNTYQSKNQPIRN